MRQANLSETIAELAVEFRDRGVCGFDIAGPEDGFPPTHHLRAFHLVQREDFHMTIHAGEAFGLPSIWEAVQFCNAERLGHGVRIADDIIEKDGDYHLGRLANFVRDRRIPLEVCPTSNVHTGAATSIATHPIELLRKLRFRVTLNTDNRLMSGISMSSEFETCADDVRLDTRRHGVADTQRREEFVLSVRSAPRDDQHGDQAGLRRACDQSCSSDCRSARTASTSAAPCASLLGEWRRTARRRRDLDVRLQLRFGARRPYDHTPGLSESQQHAVGRDRVPRSRWPDRRCSLTARSTQGRRRVIAQSTGRRRRSR